MRLTTNGNLPDKQRMIDLLTSCCKSLVERRRRTLVLSPEYTEAIARIAEYITEDTPLYGFMLKGAIGNGKSTLLEALNELTNVFVRENISELRQIFRLVTSHEIVELYTQDRDKYNSLCQADFVIIDEFGDEPLMITEYGTRVSPIHNFLTYRYRHIKFTVIGTNLTLSAIKNRYDERLVDRFKEMYPVNYQINFTHDSYR